MMVIFYMGCSFLVGLVIAWGVTYDYCFDKVKNSPGAKILYAILNDLPLVIEKNDPFRTHKWVSRLYKYSQEVMK